MPKQRKPLYKDELGKPLVRIKPVNAALALSVGMTLDELHEETRAAERRELARRFDLLFEHFDIKRTDDAALDFAALAMALAIEHVPGMRIIDQPPPRIGRPKVWSATRYMELIASIEMIKSERSCGDREACRIHLLRAGNTSPTEQAINALNARLVDARSPKKNWLYRHFHSQHGDDTDALLASIIDAYGPHRK